MLDTQISLPAEAPAAPPATDPVQRARREALVYEITSRFDASVTPAEARALFGESESPAGDVGDSDPLAWLFMVLADVDIDHESITSLAAIDFERFTGVGYFESGDRQFIFSHDPIAQSVCFVDMDRRGERLQWNDFMRQPVAQGSGYLVRFYEREKEAYAVIPGIESHWFFAPIWKNRRFLIQSAVAALLTNLFALGTSMFSMVVYNKVIPSNAMSSLVVLVTIMCFIFIADYVVKVSRAKFLGAAGIEADLAIADRLFTKVIDLQYKSRKGSVGALANTMKEYEQIREFFTSAALVSIIDMPFAVIFLIFIVLVGGWMSVPVVIGIVFLLGVTLYIQPRLKKISESSFEDSQNKHSVLVETLSGLETVKMLGAGGMLRRRFKSVLSRQATIAEETKKHTHFATNSAAVVQQAVQVAVVAVGATQVAMGTAGFGAIIACTLLSGKAMLPFSQIAQLLLRLNQVKTGYKALDELMRQPGEHERNYSYFPRGRLKGSLTFKSVDFSYPGQEGNALRDVSFSIQEGERIAIVGRVGSGKTTIGKLMARLFEPSAGAVYVDGIDLNQIDPAEIRENIGYVSQEPWLIAGTIEQNISLGSTVLSPEDISWAARLSGVSEFVDKHPQGFKMQVRERGEGLSGGQRQCITIARAIARRPPILIFDEPTSSMDARTERMFIESFRSEKIPSTLILITHRTSLLALVDRVIVMDEGKVAGIGSAESFLRGGKGAKAPKTPSSENTNGTEVENAV